MTFYIFSQGTLSSADEVNYNFNKTFQLQSEKAINDVSATNSGVLAGSSQVLIDKFLESNGQNNTVDTNNSDAYYVSTIDTYISKDSENSVVDNTEYSSQSTSYVLKATYSGINKIIDTFNYDKKYIWSGTTNGGAIKITITYLDGSTQDIISSSFTNTTYSTSTVDLYTYKKINEIKVYMRSTSSDQTTYLKNFTYKEVSFTNKTLQSNSFTIPTDATKVFVTPLMYEALSTGDSITADVSIDNGAHYTTGVPINTWTPITSANGTQLIVKMNLNTASGVSSPKILGWRCLLE